MTLPHEEADAIARVRRFLYDLLAPTVTPKAPKAIRERARQIVKHYPMTPTLEEAERMMREWGRQ